MVAEVGLCNCAMLKVGVTAGMVTGMRAGTGEQPLYIIFWMTTTTMARGTNVTDQDRVESRGCRG